MSELFRPPGFDQQVAATCKNGNCGRGNEVLPDGRGYCLYMEQTAPLDNPESASTAQLASDPQYAGWMEDECPYGEYVYNLRTNNI